MRGEASADVSSGHRALYYGCVLHRDISVGNILICPTDNNPHDTHGTLIDLDYAKLGKKKDDTSARLLEHEQWPTGAKDDYLLFPRIIRRGITIEKDAFYILWIRSGKVIDGVTVYVRQLLEVKQNLDLQRPVCSLHHLAPQTQHLT